jgi:hypothetical protein
MIRNNNPVNESITKVVDSQQGNTVTPLALENTQVYPSRQQLMILQLHLLRIITGWSVRSVTGVWLIG